MLNIRTRYTHQDYGRYVTIVVSTDTNGAVALDQTTKKGVGATITRTGIGEYLITTDQPCKDFIGASAALRMATPDGSHAVPGAMTHNSNGTYQVVIHTFDNAAPGVLFDLAAAAGNVLTGYMTVKIVGP